MGIVAHCPQGHRVKVKDYLAGKKGICPTCRARFRIPLANASLPAAADAAPIAALASLDASFALDLRLAPPEPPSLPAAIAEATSAVWCIAVPGGQPSATMNGAALFDWLTSGRVTGGELVWRSDWTDWRPVADVFPDHLPNEPQPPRTMW